MSSDMSTAGFSGMIFWVDPLLIMVGGKGSVVSALDEIPENTTTMQTTKPLPLRRLIDENETHCYLHLLSFHNRD